MMHNRNQNWTALKPRRRLIPWRRWMLRIQYRLQRKKLAAKKSLQAQIRALKYQGLIR